MNSSPPKLSLCPIVTFPSPPRQPLSHILPCLPAIISLPFLKFDRNRIIQYILTFFWFPELSIIFLRFILAVCDQQLIAKQHSHVQVYYSLCVQSPTSGCSGCFEFQTMKFSFNIFWKTAKVDWNKKILIKNAIKNSQTNTKGISIIVLSKGGFCEFLSLVLAILLTFQRALKVHPDFGGSLYL